MADQRNLGARARQAEMLRTMVNQTLALSKARLITSLQQLFLCQVLFFKKSRNLYFCGT
jgi:hypothetical protein